MQTTGRFEELNFEITSKLIFHVFISCFFMSLNSNPTALVSCFLMCLFFVVSS